MSQLNRRTFGKSTLGLLLTHSLLESLFASDALAQDVDSIAAKWIAEMNELSLDLKGEKLEAVAWQEKIEELLAKIEVNELLQFVDFERLTTNLKYRERGERAIQFKFPEVEGLPTNRVFGHQIFALKKDQSVVPHGHNNMATAFLILKGSFHGKHYDRLEDADDHMIIRPTIDESFETGGFSTVTDHKDNVHWFKSKEEGSFIFNIHVLNVDPDIRTGGRVYVDPNGESISDGRIKAPKINHRRAYELYG